MGGDIRVRSEVGKGTIFSFEIDAPPGEAVGPSARVRRVVSLAPGEDAVRILVADDRRENRMLLVKLLASVGFEVREAANGQEAVDVWQAWRPHLVWMDMRMPILDGCEATRRIRVLEGATHETKVVALTASAFEHDRETIMAAGCDGFVTKPFREQTIFGTMVELLGVRFVYDGEEAVVEEPSESTLNVERLKALDGTIVKALSDALRLGDQDAALRAIEAMRHADPTLALELERLVKTFAFDELIALVEPRDEAMA